MNLGSLAPGDRVTFELAPDGLAPVYRDRFGATGTATVLSVRADRGAYSYLLAVVDGTGLLIAIGCDEVRTRIAE